MSCLSEEVLKVAYTQITDDLRATLVKAIDNAKKARNYGHIFSEPVDFIGLCLTDYLTVVKRPMDLSTLRNNLILGEYVFLFEFLKDSELIWSNCRTYNGSHNDGYFTKAADEVERYFVSQIARIEALGFTSEIYRAIILSPIPQCTEYANLSLSVTEIQMLVKRLSELPEPHLSECINWYLGQKGIPASDSPLLEITIKFSNTDGKLLRSWDRMIRGKIQDIKEAKNANAKAKKMKR